MALPVSLKTLLWICLLFSSGFQIIFTNTCMLKCAGVHRHENADVKTNTQMQKYSEIGFTQMWKHINMGNVDVETCRQWETHRHGNMQKWKRKDIGNTHRNMQTWKLKHNHDPDCCCCCCYKGHHWDNRENLNWSLWTR